MERMMRDLSEADLAADPFQQFAWWFAEAQAAAVTDPSAMTLATATKDGRPSARVVLLKGFDDRGFVFYTNYASRKGDELVENSRAALVFYWAELKRQVRVEGSIEQASAVESDTYFQSRPRESRLAAWVSGQSRVIPSREALDRRMDELMLEYQGREIARPPHWGGYRLCPTSVEFWQSRPNRLHDRLCYRLANGAWQIERLAP
jgi:pyridoxamine 5'-phosphate oxidase